MFGLMLYGIGVTMTIKGNIGYSPWDVFHVGVSKYVHTSIGNVSIIVGLIIGLLTINLGEKLGLGTVANMIFIGVFINIFMPIIPMAFKVFYTHKSRWVCFKVVILSDRGTPRVAPCCHSSTRRQH